MTSSDTTSHLLPVYNRAPITIARGEGVYLFDDSEKRYLDFASGIAVNALGHCHPHLVTALKKQAETLWHCSNLYHTEILEKVAGRICAYSFADKVFMTNSGTEAVECGIKMVRRFHYHRGRPRPRIITVSGSFHGRTMACISAGKNAKATEGYGPLLDGFDQVPFGDLDAVSGAIGQETGGILLETIQGEGGIRVQDREYLRALRQLATESGLLLFLDEVQCGIGRTGALFAFEHYGITPDICAVAKGIGGGFPLGACLATDHAASGMTRGSHGGTYGGNPLAMAVCDAVLDVVLHESFMDQVISTGKLLKEALNSYAEDFPALVEEVRGCGLMLGLKMRAPTLPLVEAMREKGMLTVATSADPVIRFLPPLIITREHVQEAISILRASTALLQDT